MQLNFTDLEYKNRRKKTGRELFLEKMDEAVPWKEWEALVKPCYPDGKRGRRPQSIDRMLRMFLLKHWFGLSDRGTEDAIYDSYSMKRFMRLDFSANEQVPDSTTLCKFRKILKNEGLDTVFLQESNRIMKEHRLHPV